MKDPYLKLLTKYLVEFPTNTVAAWKSYTEMVLRTSDLDESLSDFAVQLENTGTTGPCVDQIKQEHGNVKSLAIHKFDICVNTNAVYPNTFNWNVNDAIYSLFDLDYKIQDVMDQCDAAGLTKDQCEVKNRGPLLVLRTQGRVENVMTVYKMAFAQILGNSQKVAACLAQTTDLIDQIDRNSQLLYQCLKQK